MVPGSNFVMVEPLDFNNSEPQMLQNFPVSNKVETLKGAITSTIGDDVHWKSICVVFEDKELDSNSKPLSHYNVKSGDTIFYIRNVNHNPAAKKEKNTLGTVYFVSSNDKASWTLNNVPTDMTVSKLRSRLAAEKGIPDSEGAHFLWGGKELATHDQLNKYELGDGELLEEEA
ncbi:hypothetical protein QBC38DRAFT_547953 [Podospora fimiseda]|uniref:Ubiquitin-like domain-containing protein n=1 Tax=Podospora fimiseda TaxID=252190 RepID=A0AAN7BIU9_9PEZI|nr:hypothetical protein QBC38DRAFT_547953 [Podospora fimiseda]